jgi:hypothetical protein
MRRVLMTVAVLLTVCFLVADSASAGRRHRGRRCHESCCVSACACGCASTCCERAACCQPAPCCQPSARHDGVHHEGDGHRQPTTAPGTKAPEMPKAPPPEVMK